MPWLQASTARHWRTSQEVLMQFDHTRTSHANNVKIAQPAFVVSTDGLLQFRSVD